MYFSFFSLLQKDQILLEPIGADILSCVSKGKSQVSVFIYISIKKFRNFYVFIFAFDKCTYMHNKTCIHKYMVYTL